MRKIQKALQFVFLGALMMMPLISIEAATPLYGGADSIFNADSAGQDAGLTNTTFFDLISNVMNWLLGLVGVLAVIGFVISGIMYLTAAGDEGQIEKAKSFMLYAIIGLVVAFVGLIVVNALGGLTGGGGGAATF